MISKCWIVEAEETAERPACSEYVENTKGTVLWWVKWTNGAEAEERVERPACSEYVESTKGTYCDRWNEQMVQRPRKELSVQLVVSM